MTPIVSRLLLATMLAGAALPALAAPALNADDRRFLTEAGTANQKEIDLSQYASGHASSANVKSFAHTMVSDHTQLGADMAQLNDGSVTVPVANSTPDPGLDGKTGNDFDQAYMHRMVSDHDATVALFQATVEGGEYSAPVRAAAKKALITIRHHDAMARSLAASLDNGH